VSAAVCQPPGRSSFSPFRQSWPARAGLPPSPGGRHRALRSPPPPHSRRRMVAWGIGIPLRCRAGRGRAAAGDLPTAAGHGPRNRAFVAQAVTCAAGQQIRQFIDLGAGLPTVQNTHEVARAMRRLAIVSPRRCHLHHDCGRNSGKIALLEELGAVIAGRKRRQSPAGQTCPQSALRQTLGARAVEGPDRYRIAAFAGRNRDPPQGCQWR
jgi:hypothetical protein